MSEAQKPIESPAPSEPQKPARPRAPLWGPLFIAALCTLGVAGAGHYLTDLGPWYEALDKPPWQPPPWMFPAAWTVIFALAALSAVLAWRGATASGHRQTIVALFILNGLLNIAWSAAFFQLQRPDWALFEVYALGVSVILLILVVVGASRLGALLLLPYLAWVVAAGLLNQAVVELNGPFEGIPELAEWMELLFVSGHVADLVIAFLVAEGILLLLWRGLTRRGIPAGAIIANVVSGACLLLALRIALLDWPPAWIALCLIVALVAHWADLARRSAPA